MSDRRIRKTRSNLFAALSFILNQTNIEEITVKELCEKADINKSTFYLHFMDIYDCCEQWLGESLDGLIKDTNGFKYETLIENPRPTLDFLLKFIEANKGLYFQLNPEPCYPKHSYNLKKLLLEKVIESNNFTKEENLTEILDFSFIISGAFDIYAQNIVGVSRQKVLSYLDERIKTHIETL